MSEPYNDPERIQQYLADRKGRFITGTCPGCRKHGPLLAKNGGLCGKCSSNFKAWENRRTAHEAKKQALASTVAISEEMNQALAQAKIEKTQVSHLERNVHKASQVMELKTETGQRIDAIKESAPDILQAILPQDQAQLLLNYTAPTAQYLLNGPAPGPQAASSSQAASSPHPASSPQPPSGFITYAPPAYLPGAYPGFNTQASPSVQAHGGYPNIPMYGYSGNPSTSAHMPSPYAAPNPQPYAYPNAAPSGQAYGSCPPSPQPYGYPAAQYSGVQNASGYYPSGAHVHTVPTYAYSSSPEASPQASNSDHQATQANSDMVELNEIFSNLEAPSGAASSVCPAVDDEDPLGDFQPMD